MVNYSCFSNFYTFYMKTNINKAISILSVGALMFTQAMNVSAATQIGTGTVTNSGALTSPINWNGSYGTATASGTINGVVVTAKVLPSLNMNISADSINLGTLTPGTEATGKVSIEVGTNAANGVQITARSTNGKLQNTQNTTAFINSTHTGESYKFSSAAGTNDSSYSDYIKTAALSTEVVNNTTEHIVATTNRPEKFLGQDDIDFAVSATATDETAAGDYKDVVVFTVTGNF